MKLHEYQAKQLLASAGIPIPRGRAAQTADEARAAYAALQRECGGAPGWRCAVKAQLHAGGRGKAGGILAATSAEEAGTCAAALLGRRLVTKQTGPDGLPVSAVLIEEAVAVRHEWYLAITIDRFRATPILLASRRGGVDIEDLAASDPAALIREPVEIAAGLADAAAGRVADALGCDPSTRTTASGRGLAQDSAPRAEPVGLHGPARSGCLALARSAWKAFEGSDASLLEINPLVLTEDGRLLALDVKIVLDDNALFRHADLAALRDESQEHPLELKAGRIGISYVGLDGAIGCLVNGAGLAMATNDIIRLAGGSPANFLDVGGGANVEQVTNAFAIILADPRVKAVLVNIFGGIMRCDWIAQGLLNATAALDVQVPIVVRLQGTNVEEGRRLLQGAKRLNLISVDELADAARTVVRMARVP